MNRVDQRFASIEISARRETKSLQLA